jgi:hypothetical protein
MLALVRSQFSAMRIVSCSWPQSACSHRFSFTVNGLEMVEAAVVDLLDQQAL